MCGPGRAAATDLFGAPPEGPIWRYAAHPLDRLAAFAADPGNQPTVRREADNAVAIYQRRLRETPRLLPPALHRTGLLMLVPHA